MTSEAKDMDTPASPLWKRLAWFVGIWTASITCLTAVAYFIRFWLGLG